MTHRTAYAKSLAQAGVLLADETLLPSSSGLRITFSLEGGKADVTVGPFSADSVLMEGFLMIEAHSVDEALERARRAPVPKGRGKVDIELRQLADPAVTYHDPNIMALETNLREQI
ncbi:YciI family protein [Paenibacillus sp. VCA1]|uniref:YciI family protein n=1 Tax=Paenibacillus sp. VCA1 TaxID=3039148 RepID=UPI0028729A46|nr:YciI family protein [Paenibacillus sp. VCA1]MDR9857920.1 YciI family protein [Paenibacillus sp. VCA1]